MSLSSLIAVMLRTTQITTPRPILNFTVPTQSYIVSYRCREMHAWKPLCPPPRITLHFYNFLVCGPKFTRFLLSNVGGVVVDQLRFRFLMSRPVPEIFAVKVRSGRKSPEILHVFGPHFLWGGECPPNFWIKFM